MKRKAGPVRKRNRAPVYHSSKPASTGTRARPVPFDLAAQKRANERLRKLEKVYKMTDDSPAYQTVAKYAYGEPNAKGSIYNVSPTGEIRFKSRTEFEKMSPQEQRYYNQVLKNFLNTQTSTKKGIEERYSKLYNTFMEHYGKKFDNLSIDEYKRLWKTYRDMVKSDRDNHFGYDEMMQLIKYTDTQALMRDDQLLQAMHYLSTDRWDKIPNRYKHTN